MLDYTGRVLCLLNADQLSALSCLQQWLLLLNVARVAALRERFYVAALRSGVRTHLGL
jgi:hypothetical protein